MVAEGIGIPLPWRKKEKEAGAQQDAQTEKMLNEHVQTVHKGTSSRAARKAAVNAIPLDKMTVENRAKASGVLESISLFRTLPAFSFEVDPQVYNFFVAHPDVAVSIWKVLGISQFQMWQTGPTNYEADAGDGTVGVIDLLYQNESQQIIFCEGVYQSPISKDPIKAKALMRLTSNFQKTRDGRIIVAHSLDMFVSFPSTTVETIAKIISPVSNMILDNNFREVSLFVHMMWQAMKHRPDWVDGVADQLENVLEVRKTQLVELTDNVFNADEAEAPPAAPPIAAGPPQSAGSGRVVATDKSSQGAKAVIPAGV